MSPFTLNPFRMFEWVVRMSLHLRCKKLNWADDNLILPLSSSRKKQRATKKYNWASEQDRFRHVSFFVSCPSHSWTLLFGNFLGLILGNLIFGELNFRISFVFLIYIYILLGLGVLDFLSLKIWVLVSIPQELSSIDHSGLYLIFKVTDIFNYFWQSIFGVPCKPRTYFLNWKSAILKTKRKIFDRGWEFCVGKSRFKELLTADQKLSLSQKNDDSQNQKFFTRHLQIRSFYS